MQVADFELSVRGFDLSFGHVSSFGFWVSGLSFWELVLGTTLRVFGVKDHLAQSSGVWDWGKRKGFRLRVQGVGYLGSSRVLSRS